MVRLCAYDLLSTSDENANTYSEDLEAQSKSTLVSRNITVMGRRTSIRLEPEMWSALKEIAQRERCSVHDICSLVSLRKREKTSLTAAIRVFLMLYFRAGCTDEGHARAGHGDFGNMVRRAKLDDQLTPKIMESRSVNPIHASVKARDSSCNAYN